MLLHTNLSEKQDLHSSITIISEGSFLISHLSSPTSRRRRIFSHLSLLISHFPSSTPSPTPPRKRGGEFFPVGIGNLFFVDPGDIVSPSLRGDEGGSRDEK